MSGVTATQPMLFSAATTGGAGTHPPVESHRDIADMHLADVSRTSGFFPDDPPYLKAAWQSFADAYRRDRERHAARKKRGKAPASWDTQLAFNEVCRCVKAAHEEGHPTFANLDPHAGIPRLTPDDDADEDDE